MNKLTIVPSQAGFILYLPAGDFINRPRRNAFCRACEAEGRKLLWRGYRL